MKQNIRVLLDEVTVRHAKRRAADERRPLSGLIQDALERYLAQDTADRRRRAAACELFCERPMRLRSGQLKVLLDHDSWSLCRSCIPLHFRGCPTGRSGQRLDHWRSV